MLVNQSALTESDKQKLRLLNKKGTTSFKVFTSVTVLAALIVSGGFYFTPGAVWPQVAVLFVGLFGFACFISWREQMKIARDIQNGMKEKVTGIISKKTISRGNQSFMYDADTLARVALREEEEELNKPITRYGVLDSEIDQAAGHWYGVEIDKVNYSIGIRNWLQVKEGDTISIEVGPQSKRVLSMEISATVNR